MTTTSHEARVGQWGPLAYVKELWARRHFVLYLGMSRIKSRNANTALGLFWWLINPLLLGMVYFLVFGVILARRPPEFIPYLLTGLFAFHFTNGVATGGARSITAGHNLMMSVVFPRLILPLATLLETLAGFLASLALLVPLVILLTPVTLSPALLLLPLVLVIHVVFSLGLGCLVARVAVPIRDLQNVVPFVMRIWLYLSPVIWPIELLDSFPDTAQALIRMNPMFNIIELYRVAILNYEFEASLLINASLWAVGMFVVGTLVFVSAETRFTRYM